jgi:hypothetical protein
VAFQGWTGSAARQSGRKSRWRCHLLQKRLPHWAGRLAPRYLGAVTRLIWEHVIKPCGRFGLDMGGKTGLDLSPNGPLVTRLLGLGLIVMADKSLLHLCSLTVLHIVPLGWEHISFNGDYDYVWSSQSLKQGFRPLEIRAPPSSMPLSVRFGTNSAMTPAAEDDESRDDAPEADEGEDGQVHGSSRCLPLQPRLCVAMPRA